MKSTQPPIKSPSFLVVKNGLEKCQFLGRMFYHKQAVKAGAFDEEEDSFISEHSFFKEVIPIVMK